MRLHHFSPVLGLVAFLSAGPLGAEEIQWRTDYTAARREAKQTNRPLVMDFGTANCTWCKKLDESTLRDPAVVKAINEQFIPLRIDADSSKELTGALGIKSFPTLVFAAPDGKILGVQDGFVDAVTCNQFLRRAQADSIAQAAATAPALAAASAGETQAAASATTKLAVRVTVPPAEPQGSAPDRDRIAHDLIALAKDDYANERFGCCLERCQTLMTSFAGHADAAAAQQLADRIKSDPGLARKAMQNLAAQLAELYMALAENAWRQNQADEAAALFERVILVCPGSGPSQIAQRRLNQIQSGAAGLPPLPNVRAQAPPRS